MHDAFELTSLAGGHVGLGAHDVVPHAIARVNRDADLVGVCANVSTGEVSDSWRDQDQQVSAAAAGHLRDGSDGAQFV